MSYRDLEIWKLARQVTIAIHRMTLECLPSYEMSETGKQIRRSIKSVRANIVEGYGRRRYKQDFIRFLTYALSSCDETTDHLETLYETGSLQDQSRYEQIHADLQTLGRMVNLFLQSVEQRHQSVKEETETYVTQQPDPNI